MSKIAVVYSDYYPDITNNLIAGVKKTINESFEFTDWSKVDDFAKEIFH